MALMGCVSSRGHEALLQAIEEAVKENALSRLEVMLAEAGIGAEEINHKSLLHQSAWLGYPRCVELLLQYGANPDLNHKKNGCTPLHLAHFCTIDDTHPGKTIGALIRAGANVNNPGSHKCGKLPIDHAIQHQRLDSVEVLLEAGSKVALNSILLAIDVANTQVLEYLLLAGGECGEKLDTTLYWGQPFHRVLYTPLKCPRKCYGLMFKLFVQATVCQPLKHATAVHSGMSKKSPDMHQMIETELRTMARDYVDLTKYLYAYLIRNGYIPTDSVKTFMNSHGNDEWVGDYLVTAASLRDLCIRVIRSHLQQYCGNILYGVKQLNLPNRVKDLILLTNPM